MNKTEELISAKEKMMNNELNIKKSIYMKTADFLIKHNAYTVNFYNCRHIFLFKFYSVTNLEF